MRERDYASELYEKMAAEQGSYRDWLLSQPPSEILQHTYEYTVREDILMAVETMEIDPKRARALLKSPCPLEEVFKDFRDRETDYMDVVRDTIESRADKIIKRDKAREVR